jgi:hypothetical protein
MCAETAKQTRSPSGRRGTVGGIQGGVTMLLTTGSIAHLEAALDLGIAQLRNQAG